MAAAMALGGFTGPEADTLGYAIRKKKSSVLRSMREQFVTQAAERGVRPETIDAVFTAFEPFERYGFNKAHATTYGLVAYQTAYLKANYTVEYMTSVLTAFRDNAEKVAAAVAECRRLGIAVLPPDVHASHLEFTVEGEAIRFGLLAVKNVGAGRDRVDHRRPRGRRPVPLARRLLQPDRPAPGEQAGPRVAGQGGRAQRVRAPGPAPRWPSTTSLAAGPGRPARAGLGPDQLLRPGRRAGRARGAAARGIGGARPRAAALGEGAPGPVPVRPSARRGRRADRPVRDAPTRATCATNRSTASGSSSAGVVTGPAGSVVTKAKATMAVATLEDLQGTDRGRRLPAPLRADRADVAGGRDPPRRRAGSTTAARRSRSWPTSSPTSRWPPNGARRPSRPRSRPATAAVGAVGRASGRTGTETAGNGRTGTGSGRGAGRAAMWSRPPVRRAAARRAGRRRSARLADPLRRP